MVKWSGLGATVRIRVRTKDREWVFAFLFFFLSAEHLGQGVVIAIGAVVTAATGVKIF